MLYKKNILAKIAASAVLCSVLTLTMFGNSIIPNDGDIVPFYEDAGVDIKFKPKADLEKLIVADLDGNGYLDLIRQENKLGTSVYYNPGYSFGNEKILLNRKSFKKKNTILKKNNDETMLYISSSKSNVIIGDFNGNGMDDYLLHSNKENISELIYLEKKKNQFGAKELDTTRSTLSYSFIEGDFNGDGKTDILRVYKDNGCNGRACDRMLRITDILTKNKSSFSRINGLPRSTRLGLNQDKIFVADFNGDGRDDILSQRFDIDNAINYPIITLWMNTNKEYEKGEYKEYPISYMKNHQRGESEVHIGDFNGDNMDDLLIQQTIQNNPKELPEHLVLTSFSDGKFNNEDSFHTEWNMDVSNLMFHIGDFNGDNKSDILLQYKNDPDEKEVQIFENISQPDEHALFQAKGSTLYEKFSAENANLIINDFNNDGKSDILKQEKFTSGANEKKRTLKLYLAN